MEQRLPKGRDAKMAYGREGGRIIENLVGDVKFLQKKLADKWTMYDPADRSTWPDHAGDWEVTTKDGHVVSPCTFDGEYAATDAPYFWQYIISKNDVGELHDVLAYRKPIGFEA